MVSPIGEISATGAAITVTSVVRIQPVLSVYVIVVVPPAMPVKAPVPVTMVPAAGLLLLQVPPASELVRVTVEAGQTVVEPPIAAGRGLTVSDLVRTQPLVGCV